MSPLPKWYKPVAIVALLWNLMGVAAYLADVTMSPEAIAQLDAAQRAMYEARPMWFVAAYAIAVWLGTAGSLGLVLRKRWAGGLLLASLLGLIVQDVALFTRPEFTAAGAAVVALQGSVRVIAVWLVLLARKANAQGWLS